MNEARRSERLARRPVVEYPPELPVSAKHADIAAAISANQVVIVCGETGSGKTTQLPKICLELGRGIDGLIGHTQPRRIAARATASRIAQELNTELGQAVGFKIRFTDRTTSNAYIKLMTDGILLAESQGDPWLRNYDTIIIDEAHERSLNIDFLLGYLKQLLPRRPDLKLIITSATLDAQRFAKHFASAAGTPAPVIEVSGRLYPVQVRYRPIDPDDDDADLNTMIVTAADELAREGPGDILVFLPGEREIREAAEALRKHHPPATEILPLYARLSVQEQERIFKLSQGRRIVLATNVAETSLTVPGIRYVIDSGFARVKRYSFRNKVEQLQVERVAQSAAQQRAGRCGRVAAGVCIRLYDEDDFNKRPAFTEPEILRSSLAAVILRMKGLALGEIEAFPFIEPPAAKAIVDGYALLTEIGAIDEQRQLTETGRHLAKLPVDPRIGRMILAAKQEGALAEVLVIAAALAVSDPRERPMDKQQAADEKHKRFADERSDFFALLKMWTFFDEGMHHESQRKLARACRDHFLSFNRMREWRDIHAQLKELVGELGWKAGGFQIDAGQYQRVHRALLAGLLGNIGLKTEDGPHLGARGIKFYIHPGSGLSKKAPRWIVAGEMVETTRLYARSIASIEPLWVEQIGAHLLKRSHAEPHWEKKLAQVVALERGTLYGIPIYINRKVHFGSIDPIESRRIFIREGLVDGEYESRAPFYQHNRRLISDIEALEHKSRRPDVLVDDELIFAFYDELIPADVVNGRGFEAWLREVERADPKRLFLKREELMRHEAAGITTTQFPQALELAGRTMALSYEHDPGGARDGVTMTLPLIALNQIPIARTEWLVPGLLRDKVQSLAKSLPQRIRHQLGPLAEFAADFVAAVPPRDAPLAQTIGRYTRDEKQVTIPFDAFRVEAVPAHLFMNFRIVDEHGRQLGMGRNLAQLRAELGGAAEQQFKALVATAPIPALVSKDASTIERAGRSTTWTFGSIDDIAEIGKGLQVLVGYPAIVDDGDAVYLDVFDAPDKARAAHRNGLRRLFMLTLREQAKTIEKSIAGLQPMILQFAALGDGVELKRQLLIAAFERTCMTEPWPNNAERFAARVTEARSRLGLVAQEIIRAVQAILAEVQVLGKKLQGAKSSAETHADITAQLERLVGKHFITSTPYERLSHYPRYLKAIHARLDKLRADPARDARLLAELSPLQAQWLRAVAAQRKSGAAMDAGLDQFGWLLEELRVALFAQELRTPMPVSSKRLLKMWHTLER